MDAYLGDVAPARQFSRSAACCRANSRGSVIVSAVRETIVTAAVRVAVMSKR